MPETDEVQKPEVTLVGQDGNAFSIMGTCRRAWQKAGKDMAEWEKIQEDMMSDDYNHLLFVAMEHFDVR